MPTDDLSKAFLERRPIKFAVHAQALRNVVKGIVGFQLIQEPQALLRKRQRQLLITTSCGEHWRRRHGSALLASFFDERSETRNRRRLKQCAQWEFHTARL